MHKSVNGTLVPCCEMQRIEGEGPVFPLIPRLSAVSYRLAGGMIPFIRRYSTTCP